MQYRPDFGRGSIALRSYHLSKQFLLGAQPIDSLFLHDAAYYRDRRIELMLASPATAVDTAAQIVHLGNGGQIHYGKLLIATGTRPVRPSVPDSALPGFYHLHTLSDAEQLRRAARLCSRAAVLGGSFLGLEVATTLKRLGLQVTLIEQEPCLLNQLAAPKLSAFFLRYCADRGIDVCINETAAAFKGNNRIEAIATSSGRMLPCDLVVATIGVVPEVDFLRGSGIAIEEGIVVDHHLEASVTGIFAAGDVARFYDPVFRQRRRVEHWDNAVKQGRLAARNMLGRRLAYEEVSYFFCNVLDANFSFLGSTHDAGERVARGSLDERSFALFYLRDDVLRATFSMGRPASEVLAAEMLIRDRVDLASFKARLGDRDVALESIPTRTVLALQGGGALGAFECGVVKALEESRIRPDVIAGVSIGAFNGAIIASHPENAAATLEDFWNDLAVATPVGLNEEWRRAISSWWSQWFGSPRFFWPNWWLAHAQPPWTWTSLYDTRPARTLLEKYVDFAKLKDSPVRLLISTVNVETAELEIFDSRADDITVDHIMASGSLPPAFPWTGIQGNSYWDAGIVSNSPLEFVNERCGETSKRVFIVDLFASQRPLPKNLAEVLMRRDEIVFAERTRNDMRLKEKISDFRNLIEEIIDTVGPEARERLRQNPRFIQLMADAGPTSVVRIVNEVRQDELPFLDNDFSVPSIARHKQAGYEKARRALAGNS
jgi:NTE family protein